MKDYRPYDKEEISYGKWMLTLLLLAIPIVNIVLLIVWAISDYDGRRNYARAVLTYYVLSIIFAVLMMLFVGSTLGSFAAGLF